MHRRRALALLGVVTSAGCEQSIVTTPTQPLSDQVASIGRVENADDRARVFRVGTRGVDRDNGGSATATHPAGERARFAVSGRLVAEERSVTAQTPRGSVSSSWRPTDCPHPSADVVIRDGRPRLTTNCRVGPTPTEP